MTKNIVVFGYGYEGIEIYSKLIENKKYQMYGFVDNSVVKQGNYSFGNKILSMQELVELCRRTEISVIIASRAWQGIALELSRNNISIEGICHNGKLMSYCPMTFEKLLQTKDIKLYAGDITDPIHMKDENLFGLSISESNEKHILHDITNPYPLPDNSVVSYQAEDVLEHIAFDKLIYVIDEIYRILKPNALFRICLPDYNSLKLTNRSMINQNGEILFDPAGGGAYSIEGVINGGHVWFPTYSIVKEMLRKTRFRNVSFLCYRDEKHILHKNEIDYAKGYIIRVTDEMKDADIYSMVIDCYK